MPAFTPLHQHTILPSTDDDDTPITYLSGILCTAWCPSMDLVAYITTDNVLHVRRLSWQLLFTLEVDSKPTVPTLGTANIAKNVGLATCITWRSDGKALYVGHVSGSVTVIAVEDRSVAYRYPINAKCAVTSLQWCQFSAAQLHNTQQQVDSSYSAADIAHESLPPTADSTNVLYPTLPVLPKPTPLIATQQQQQSQSTASQTNEIDPLNQISATVISDAHIMQQPGVKLKQSKADASASASYPLLLVTDIGGHVTLLAYGTLPICSLHVEKELSGPVAVTAAISGNYKLLSLTCSSADSTHHTLHSIHTHLLFERRYELQYIAVQYQQLLQTYQYLTECSAVIESRWKYIRRQLAIRFDPLTDVVGEHLTASMEAGGSSAVEVDETLKQSETLNTLFEYLATGVPSAALLEFAQRFLSVGPLTKSAALIDTFCTKITELIQSALTPAIYQLHHRLTELRAQARWTERYACLGLDVTQLTTAIEWCTCTLKVTHEVQLSVVQFRSDIAAFFHWFIPQVKILANERDEEEKANEQQRLPAHAVAVDVSKVMNCIECDLFIDRIGVYFAEDSLSTTFGINLPTSLPKLPIALTPTLDAAVQHTDAQWLRKLTIKRCIDELQQQLVLLQQSICTSISDQVMTDYRRSKQSPATLQPVGPASPITLHPDDVISSTLSRQQRIAQRFLPQTLADAPVQHCLACVRDQVVIIVQTSYPSKRAGIRIKDEQHEMKRSEDDTTTTAATHSAISIDLPATLHINHLLFYSDTRLALLASDSTQPTLSDTRLLLLDLSQEQFASTAIASLSDLSAVSHISLTALLSTSADEPIVRQRTFTAKSGRTLAACESRGVAAVVTAAGSTSAQQSQIGRRMIVLDMQEDEEPEDDQAMDAE